LRGAAQHDSRGRIFVGIGTGSDDAIECLQNAANTNSDNSADFLDAGSGEPCWIPAAQVRE
jgi:hypothetical protein